MKGGGGGEMLTDAHVRKRGYLKCSREHSEHPNFKSNSRFVFRSFLLKMNVKVNVAFGFETRAV